MSAAAPLPPNPPQHAPGTVGTTSTSPTTNGTNRERVFAHIEDLQKQAGTGFNQISSVKGLIDAAEKSLGEAVALVQWRRPDAAFVEFTRSFEIATSVIPSHSGYVDFQHDDKQGLQRLKVLQRRLIASTEQFLNIKGIIENNNRRHMTRPAMHTNGVNGASRDSVIGEPQRPDSRGSNGIVKIKPVPSPKPQALHGRAVSAILPSAPSQASAASHDVLVNRFSKLRLNTGTANGLSNRHTVVLGRSSSPSSFSGFGDPRNSMLSNGQQYPGQPVFSNGSGTQSLNQMTSNGDMHLPKPPSPTYSPARNMDTNGNIALPRYSARSLAGNDVRRPIVSPPEYLSMPDVSPIANGDEDAISPSINGALLGSTVRRRRSSKTPSEKSITAERLYDYLRLFQVLLIDVRSRDQFDQGHIFHRNIMCVEPMILRQGMSAEQLQESLVISPEAEQNMFDQINQFDLVVFYDKDTSSENFLPQPRSAQDLKLKYLYEALCEFNQEKPLQAQPMLLKGGLDAWCELAGSQSLAISNTSSRVRGSVIPRRPVANPGRSELRLSKRRLRDYNPLDKEEEQKWMERARQESISAPAPPKLYEADEEVAQANNDPDSGNAAIEEFLNRFPDAGLIDRQPGFMANQIPARMAPQLPAKVPVYPARPQTSAQPPTRPLPAAPRMSYNGVSDRAAPALVRTSSAMAPYIPPKYMAANLRVPKTGLVNFGITCYLNSTLQALSATTPLSTFFLDDDFRRQVQKDNWKGSKGVMPELYSTVIRSLWSGDVQAIRPTTFRNFCGRLNREWTIERQQDAKEFFDFLIDCLHEDLNQRWSQTLLRELTEAEEQKRESMPKTVVAKLEWERYTHREQSFLTTLFGGQHASLLRCKTCGVTSTKHEAFYSISVEIPQPRSSSGVVTLDECLRSYCAEEMLSGDEVWRCPHCRREREATKQITITRAPQFLVVHFKRFAAGHSTTTRKVRTPIEFPLERLDLEPYMLPPNTPQQTEFIAKHFDARFLKQDVTMRPPYLYDAYAVMRHIGQTMTSGHYTCAVKDRNRGCWRMFNDTKVDDFQPEQLSRRDALTNEEAYIVFYARRPTT